MKKYLYSFVALLTAIFALSSCEDVPAPYDLPGTGNGSGATVEEVAKGTGTLEDPYNAKGANDYISTLESNVNSENKIYVKGVVVQIKEQFSSYGNATFYIADSQESTTKFYVYRALGLGNQPCKDPDALKEGDEVIVCGNVVNYNGNTPETVQNKAYVYSINGKTEDEGTPVTGENLLVNGDFETWADGLPTNWKSASTASNAVLSQSTDAHGGSYSVMLGNPGTANKRLAYKEITLKAGTYEFSFYAKSTTPDASQTRPGYVPVTNGKVGDYAYGGYATINNTSWTQVSHTFTLDATTTVCLVVMNPKGSDYAVAQDILIDDATLKTNDGGIVEEGGNTTPDTPSTTEELTVAQALALIAGMEPAAQSSEQYIVSGKVAEVTEISALYGNATVVLEGGFTVFRFKGFNGANFTDENAIKVGDNIKVKGYLKKYVKDDVITPELVNGTLIELNGTTAGNDEPNTPNEGNEKVVTFVAGTDVGTLGTSGTGADAITKSGVTIAITGGTLSRTDNYRTYKSQSMTVSSEKEIASIEFTCTAEGDAQYGPGCWTAPTIGAYSYEGKVGTWTGSAKSITFAANTAQVRASKIVVTLK